MDYALPRANQVPALDVEHLNKFPSVVSPRGIKGVGESGGDRRPHPPDASRVFELLRRARPA
jgi:hypothetical protein